MSDIQSILSQEPGDAGKPKLSEEKIQAYLDGKLPPAGQHEVELWLAGEGMESDALEGLHGLPPSDVKHAVHQLNHKLRKTILKKKRRRKPLNTGQVTWVAIVVILLLAVLAFIVLRKLIP